MISWLSDLPKPLKYGLCAGGIGVTSVLAYYYITNQNKEKASSEVPKGIERSGNLTPVPEIVIDTEPEDLNDVAQSSTSDSTLPGVADSELRFKNVTREPVEDLLFEDDCSEQKPSRKVLLLGLEKSGKSSLLSQLSREGTNCVEYEPTKGFNVVCISFDNIDLSIWEIGGGHEYRTYWKNFCASTNLIFFVVDSSDRSKFKQAREFFYDVFNDLSDEIGFHIIAAKSDKENAASSEELLEALGLEGTNWEVTKIAAQAGGADHNVGLDKIQEYALYH